MSASQGFGQEAFGKETGYLERIVNLFGHVPVFSDLAYILVKFLGLQNEADEWVPKFTIVLLGFAVPLAGILIRSLLHLWMVATRIVTKGTGANARFATFSEVFKGYTIPSQFSTIIFSFLSGLTLTLAVIMLLDVKINDVTFLVLGLFLGTLIRVWKGSYSEIRKKAQPYPLGRYNMLKLYLTGGYRLSFIRGDVKEQRESHMIVLGPTGSGKTTRYFIPGILEDSLNNCSAIVVEAKASEQEDMFKLIAPSWAAAGKKVILYDPWGGGGVSFNPLMSLKASFDDPETRDVIEDVVDAIYRTYEAEKGSASGDAAFHVDNEKRLLKNLLTVVLFKPKEERNLAAVYEVVNGTLESAIEYINSTISIKSSTTDMKNGGTGIEHDIRKHLSWFTDKDNGRPDLKTQMLSGLAGKLAVFSHPRVKECVVNDELDLDVVFKEPALFCIKSPLNVPGASTISSIIIRLLITRVPKKLTFGGGPNHKVYFYLDELPALCIPKFDQFTKTARSSGTGIIAAIQDRVDVADIIRPKLGISSVDGLLANFKTQVLLAGLQPGTAKFFSDAFGKKEFKARRTIRDTKNPIDFSYTNTRDEKPLLTADAIRGISTSDSIIVDSNSRPFFVRTIPWYSSSRYRGMIKKNANNEIKLHKKSSKPVKYQSPSVVSYPATDKKKVKHAFKDISDMNEDSSAAPAAFENSEDMEGGRTSGSSGSESLNQDAEVQIATHHSVPGVSDL